jgi:long-chain acyl-CoA synthetase
MSNPLDLLPLALASRNGVVDGQPASQLAAAGLALLQRSPKLIRALYGKRAAILLPTGASYLTALAACEGRAAVLLNPLASPAELAYQLADAEVGAVMTVEALSNRLPAGIPRVWLDAAPRSAVVMGDAADTGSVIDLGSHVGLALEADLDETVGSDEEAAVVYTSAMEGRPLGAILTHRNLLANAHATVLASALTASDHVLAVLPYSHLLGLTVTLSAPMLVGSRVTTMPRFNPLKAVDALVNDAVTMIVGVPSVFIGMLSVIERRGGTIDAPSLRLSICGGAPLPVWVQRKWEAATGCALRQGYGLTEAGPVVLFNHVDAPNVLGALGVAYPGAEVSIRDSTTNVELPRGASGEICVRGPIVSPRYVRHATGGLPRMDGWLHSGDRGQMSADGVVTFEGVIKPMFTRNGFNIYPAELTRMLREMPGVTNVEAAALPEPTKENEIEVTVYGTVTEAAVRAWCDERLSSYKQPTRIIIVA